MYAQLKANIINIINSQQIILDYSNDVMMTPFITKKELAVSTILDPPF